MTPEIRAKIKAFANDLISDEPPAVRQLLADLFDDQFDDFARAWAPHLLVEQVGAVGERYAVRNDYARKLVAAE